MPPQTLIASSSRSAETSASDEPAMACRAAAKAFESWRQSNDSHRREGLERWAQVIESRADEFARAIATEIGKPIRDARAEVATAQKLIRAAAARCSGGDAIEADPKSHARVRRMPHGVVAIITTWNNPLAIPAGKIAPAIAMRNAVVWKPASEARRSSELLLASLIESGLPSGLVNLVCGDAAAAQAIIHNPLVRAVSLTGGTVAGRAVAMQCARRGIPLQAELGGNNAGIILSDYDFKANMREIVRASFSFAGQRCTAIRRWIVERPIFDEFSQAFVRGVCELRIGDPLDEDTDIGPLVSFERRAAIIAAVARSVADGANLVCGGDLPPELGEGHWLRPAVLDRVAPDSWIAQQETFGPVALLMQAENLDHALALANGVAHGLVCTLLSNDPRANNRFLDRAEAGALNFAPGPLPVCPEAPFGGWKASGNGFPEHGEWDVHFYTRPQAVYANNRTNQHVRTSTVS